MNLRLEMRDDLRDEKLVHLPYGSRKIPSFDDRCAICDMRFEKETMGYTTGDHEVWVCEGCYERYKEDYGWRLKRDVLGKVAVYRGALALSGIVMIFAGAMISQFTDAKATMVGMTLGSYALGLGFLSNSRVKVGNNSKVRMLKVYGTLTTVVATLMLVATVFAFLQ